MVVAKLRTLSLPDAPAVYEELQRFTAGRGLHQRSFVGAIYTMACKNQKQFDAQAPSRPAGKSKAINGNVSDAVFAEIKAWQKKRKTTLRKHCLYILERTLSDPELLEKAVRTLRAM